MTADSRPLDQPPMDPVDADLLVASVMSAVRASSQNRAPVGLRLMNTAGAGALGAAAAIVLIVGGFVLVNAPSSGAGSASPSPATMPALATFHEAGLSFDYPADWIMSSSEVVTGPGLSPAFFVGSAAASATCQPVPSSGGALECNGFIASLERNTAVVRIVIDQSTPWMQRYIADGATRNVVIGGLPALTGPSTPLLHLGADRTTTWIVASLQDLNRRYVITAAMRGPDLAGLQSQVDALLASVSFDPPGSP